MILSEAITGRIEMPLRGLTGKDGLSAYEVACKNGFIGTEKEWLETITTKEEFEKLKSDTQDVILADGTQSFIHLGKTTREVVVKGENVSIGIIVPKDCWVGWRCAVNLSETGSLNSFDVGFDEDRMFGSDATWSAPEMGKAYMLAKVKNTQTPQDFILYELDSIKGYTEEEKTAIEKAHLHSNQALLDTITEEKIQKWNNGENLFSNPLIGAKRGKSVVLGDASPLEHKVECRVESKNLIPYPYVNSKIEQNGITFTANSDGSITVNGTATAYTVFTLSDAENPVRLPVNTGVVFSSGYDNADDTVNIAAKKIVNGIVSDSASIYPKKNGFAFVPDCAEYNIYAYVKEGVTVDNVTMYPQIEVGTKATEYEAYVPIVEGKKITKYGKNLIPYPYVHSKIVQNGITFTANGDGSITVNGTATAYTSFTLSNVNKPVRVPVNTSVVFSSGYNNTNSTVNIVAKKIINGVISNAAYIYPKKTGYTFVTDVNEYNVYAYVQEGVTVDNVTIYPQIEIGTTATDYEQYRKAEEYITDSNGVVANIMTSISPNMTLVSDTSGVVIDVNYKRDVNKAFEELTQAIISLGGNI